MSVSTRGPHYEMSTIKRFHCINQSTVQLNSESLTQLVPLFLCRLCKFDLSAYLHFLRVLLLMRLKSEKIQNLKAKKSALL